MNRLDEELAQVVDDAKGEVPPTAAEPPPPPRVPGRRGHRRLGLAVALVVMGGAILAVVFSSFESAAVYSKGVDELMAERERLSDRHVRVEGKLVSGTLQRREQPCEYRFVIEKNGERIPVRYANCVVPDTLRDVPGMEVLITAEGSLDPAGHFEADQILTKCPSKYDMNQGRGGGDKAPHVSNTKDSRQRAAALPGQRN